MATIPRNIARIHASLPGLRTELASSITSVTQRIQLRNPSPSLRPANGFSMPKESEDARITGGTRSLDRRLLALNLAPFAKVKPARSAPAPQRMAAPLHPNAA